MTLSNCGCNASEVCDYTVEVVSNKKLADRDYWITFAAPELAEKARPGLSVMVFPQGSELLLGRPFAVADADKERGEISLCFFVLGAGTERLSQAKAGDIMKLRGFLGVPCKETEDNIILACGGAGIGALCLTKRMKPETSRIWLGIPGRGYEAFAAHFKELFPDTKIFTDDGSFGDGNSMFNELPRRPDDKTQIWSCGPEGFLKALYRHCERPERLYFNLDKRMACGYGGCMGCVIETESGPKRVCVDQSMFRADEVNLDDN